MSKSIHTVSNAGNPQLSVYSGAVTPELEKQWAADRASCLIRYKKKHNKSLYTPKPVRRFSGLPVADVKWEFDAAGKLQVAKESRQFDYLHDWHDARLVSEIVVGEQDVYITNSVRGGIQQKGGGVRGAIKGWSKQSRSRCERHIRNVSDGSIKSFLTLTYPKSFTSDGKRVKRDLTTMIKRLKRMGVNSGIWFLEFQKRGAPHLHCFIGQWPVGGVRAVSVAWHKIVGTDDPKHLDWHLGKLSGRPCLELMKNPHAASYYACKYAVKSEQKDVPELFLNVGRFWGYWGDLKPVFSVYYARGQSAAESAIRMIRWWKHIKFGGTVGIDLVIYSATLRGCTLDMLSSLMESTGWCPD